MQKSKIVFCVSGNFSRAAEARWVPKKSKNFRQMAGEIKGGKIEIGKKNHQSIFVFS